MRLRIAIFTEKAVALRKLRNCENCVRNCEIAIFSKNVYKIGRKTVEILDLDGKKAGIFQSVIFFEKKLFWFVVYRYRFYTGIEFRDEHDGIAEVLPIKN